MLAKLGQCRCLVRHGEGQEEVRVRHSKAGGVLMEDILGGGGRKWGQVPVVNLDPCNISRQHTAIPSCSILLRFASPPEMTISK